MQIIIECRCSQLYGSRVLSSLVHYYILEINVNCNFKSTKNKHNRLLPGNLSFSDPADKDEFSVYP